MTDVSELRNLGLDLGKAGQKALPEIEKVVKKGAVNIKNDMRTQLGESRYFRGIAKTVDFDIETHTNAVEAEIGPRSRLANIAYFGASRGGGGTVDLTRPLEEERPRFERAVAEVLNNVL